MSKEILINLLVANSPYMSSPGAWTLPTDTTAGHGTLAFWTNLARIAERGMLDCIFLADTFGVFDVYKSGAEIAIRHGVRIPAHDPILVIPAMAQVTKNVCFAVTQNTSVENPYLLARRLATLDHLLDGRLAWNIVTGFQESGAKAVGLKQVADPAKRYAMLDEYMEVVYKLLESGWDPGAVVRDKVSGIYSDPEKVHKVSHNGVHFQMEGYHLVEPSRQRVPVLFQAGASGPGRAFAARNAECVFMIDSSHKVLAQQTAAIRQEARQVGRDAMDIKAFAGYTVIVGRTDKEAQEKYQSYFENANLEAALTFASGSIGLDLSKFDPNQPIPQEVNNAQVRSIIDTYSGNSASGKVWTPREIALHMAVGGRSARVVGSAEKVADHLIKTVAETDIDGFALSSGSTPSDYIDFVDLVVPILQERGAFKHHYQEGTFRKKLFGADSLSSRHPGFGYRRTGP